MKKPIKTTVKFKDYSQGQVKLLPPSLEEMIDVHHPVRVDNWHQKGWSVYRRFTLTEPTSKQTPTAILSFGEKQSGPILKR